MNNYLNNFETTHHLNNSDQDIHIEIEWDGPGMTCPPTVDHSDDMDIYEYSEVYDYPVYQERLDTMNKYQPVPARRINIEIKIEF